MLVSLLRSDCLIEVNFVFLTWIIFVFCNTT